MGARRAVPGLLDRLGQAEVRDLDGPEVLGVLKEDVLELQVAVDDVRLVVEVAEPLEDGDKDGAGVRLGVLAPGARAVAVGSVCVWEDWRRVGGCVGGGGALLLDCGEDVAAFEVLHDEVDARVARVCGGAAGARGVSCARAWPEGEEGKGGGGARRRRREARGGAH